MNSKENSLEKKKSKLNPLEWMLSAEFFIGLAVILLTAAGFVFKRI